MTRFLAYEAASNRLKDPATGKMTVAQTLACGLLSGVAEAIVAGEPRARGASAVATPHPHPPPPIPTALRQ
jgi:hypothetical protein